jgi:primosomal replication protein N
VAFEGVTCDLCHKIKSVDPGPSPGLDGSIELLRPSEDTFLPNQEYRPITFGPYADVIVPIMNGSYAPQFQEAEWCSSCHEYAQPALHPDQALSDRWPEGIPVFETWTEYTASNFEGQLSCQDCHMPALNEESSTYDITSQDLQPSVDQGWMREIGEVRHHAFSRAGLGSPSLTVEVSEVDGELEVIASVKNSAAGHAVPTGEPMKQLLLEVRAFDEEGAEVSASGGQAVPDVGGYRAVGFIGEDADLEGQTLTISGSALDDSIDLSVRFTRPTGSWDDYDGPGTAPFSSEERSAEDKGMAPEDFLGEVAVSFLEGDELTLAGDAPQLQEGDRVYVTAETDYAGAPGWVYAKILVDADGARGVPHYRAVDVASDNRIAPGGSASSTHRFPLQSGSLTIEATLIRRDRAAPVAEIYGWTVDDETITTTTEVVAP